MPQRSKDKRTSDGRWSTHPLYGSIPLIRHATVGRNGRTYEWWEYDPKFSPRIPKGAVPGDVSRQVYCTACHVPKYFYVNETRTCVQCGSRFTFSGAEQKYWYETRKFNFRSVPIRCKGCRRLRRSEHAMREQIARVRRSPEMSVEEVEAAREAVRQWVSLAVVRFIGAHTGCSCGFPHVVMTEKPLEYWEGMFGDDDREEDLRSVESLIVLVREQVRATGEVQLYPVWNGEEGKPPKGVINLGLAALIAKGSSSISSSSIP